MLVIDNQAVPEISFSCCISHSNFILIHSVSFPGPHKIDVTYEGLQVPGSPFPVGVVPGCDPTRVKAYGPGKCQQGKY